MPQIDRDNYFTKHLFRAGIECPTKLYYYSKGYAQSRQTTPFIEHAIYNKELLKALLRSIYTNGVSVAEDSVEDAARETKELLKKQDVVLFNAIFEHRQMMARLPVAIKSGNELTAFHVQTKAFDSRKHRLCNAKGTVYSKWRRYILDFAYQLFLIRRQYPDFKIIPILVLPEKSGNAQEDNLPRLLQPFEMNTDLAHISVVNQKLLAKLNVDELITEVLEDPSFASIHLPKDTFETSLNYLRSLYFNQEKANPRVGLKCKSCEFNIERKRVAEDTPSGFLECWKPVMNVTDLLNAHVFNLIGPGTAHWMQHQIYNQRNVPNTELFSTDSILHDNGRLTQQMRQSLQVYKARGQKVPEEIIRSQLPRELKRWEYPLHFLDFEAGNYAVPVRRNRSPYALVVFQFSCHTLHEDGSWNHHQWIDDFSGGYVSYEIVR
ncbi:MAG TPA: DUF2779 domain-containing protein, partial [Balneolaceae bacterium]|nr:DUF2779 domain-containing protein [Balneolaceae bacterium]